MQVLGIRMQTCLGGYHSTLYSNQTGHRSSPKSGRPLPSEHHTPISLRLLGDPSPSPPSAVKPLGASACQGFPWALSSTLSPWGAHSDHSSGYLSSCQRLQPPSLRTPGPHMHGPHPFVLRNLKDFPVECNRSNRSRLSPHIPAPPHPLRTRLSPRALCLPVWESPPTRAHPAALSLIPLSVHRLPHRHPISLVQGITSHTLGCSSL